MYEIWIDRERLDLYPDTQIAVTKQSIDLSELIMNTGDYSNSFNIPLTPNNRRILGYADLFNSAENKAYETLDARLLIDGMEILHSAKLKIDSVGENFKISVCSSNVDFFEAIGDKMISDLSTTGINHTMSTTTMMNSRSYTAEQGFIYPLIDSVYNSQSDWTKGIKNHPSYGWIGNMRYFFPCVFIKWLFKLIVQEAGYTASGDILDDDLFSNSVIPWSRRSELEMEAELDTFNRYNTSIVMQSIAPELSQKEFLKGIAYMFGLIYQADFSTKTLNIHYLDDLFTGYARTESGNVKSEDWSSKLNLNTKPEISFSLGDFAQRNNIRYKSADVPAWAEVMGKGVIECKNKNLPANKDLYELPFSTSISYMSEDIDYVFLHTLLTFDWYNDVVTWLDDSTIRILYVNRINYSDGFSYHVGNLLDMLPVTTDIPTCYWYKTTGSPTLAFSSHISMYPWGDPASSEVLMEYYYSKLRNVLEYVKVVRCYVNLTTEDIYNFSQLNLVWIEYFHSYFFVNKIDRFTGRGSTAVELIKV